MRVLDIITLILAFAIVPGNATAQLSPRASLIPIKNVDFNDRALNILVALADRYKVVVGVYGTLIGSDSGTIRISIREGTLRDVLDALVNQDGRFEWSQSDDGSIHVRTKEAPLSLTAVKVSSLDIENPKRMEAVQLLSRIPEVSSWLQQHGCSMDEMLAGPLPQDWGQFSVRVTDKPLSGVLDEMAARSSTYFWSLIRYNDQPCSINLRP
jgi:hypothetical protein